MNAWSFRDEFYAQDDEWTRRVKCSPKDDLFSESHRVTCVRIVRGEWNPSMIERKYVYEIVAGEERNYAFFLIN